MASVPLSTVDARNSGVYSIRNVCLHPGTTPTLEFFTDDGQVPTSFAEDLATAVWIGSTGERRNERDVAARLERLPRYATEDPVYLFLVQDNPAHSLHDVVFSVAFFALAADAQRPCFSSFVDPTGQPCASWDVQWSRFVHRACGFVEPWGEILREDDASSPIFFPHLVVPKFMRHRFAHTWSSTSGWRVRGYIDQTADYPQHLLEGLQRRLYSSCFAEVVRPWSDRGSGRFASLLLHDRGGSFRRRWANGSQMFAWLERYFGDRFSSMRYVSEDYESLTPGEQARLFHEAEVVIAPHGAALANLIFCRPGTRILEFTDEAWSFGWSTFTNRLGMSHFPARPASLQEHDQESFEVRIEEMQALMTDILVSSVD